MKTELPISTKEMKLVLEENFEEIADFIKAYKVKDYEQIIKSIYEKHYEQLQKEIRAIVLPEMSPLEVTQQVENCKTDLEGQKHNTIAERIESDFTVLKEALAKKQSDSKVVLTQNGTIMHDFTSKSKIRKVKKIACIGDSVARGSHSKKNYGQMLGEKLGAKVTNHAVSGATMSTVKSNSIYEQANKIHNADLVIVQGTDDDWLFNGFNGVSIGNSKTDVSTYYGAFYQTIQKVKQLNKGVDIVVMTATRQLPVKSGNIRREDTEKNKLGLKLENYVNAQVLACSELNIPVFDAYHTNLLDPYNPAFRVKNMPDGLHPNELAHEVIMYELIKNYYYFYG